ncbi:hypothetical protein BHE74_00051788, partial [Ensete ventricosum]
GEEEHDISYSRGTNRTSQELNYRLKNMWRIPVSASSSNQHCACFVWLRALARPCFSFWAIRLHLQRRVVDAIPWDSLPASLINPWK